MARTQTWKPVSDAQTDLEEALVQLKIVADMLLEADPATDGDRINYLTDNLHDHVDRARRAFRSTFTGRARLIDAQHVVQ